MDRPMDEVRGTTCPKCAVGVFGPPIYRETKGWIHTYDFVGEHLAYICGFCGYTHAEPTKDSIPTNPTKGSK